MGSAPSTVRPRPRDRKVGGSSSRPDKTFINIGERDQMSPAPPASKLIRTDYYDTALRGRRRQQSQRTAPQFHDTTSNMDEGMPRLRGGDGGGSSTRRRRARHQPRKPLYDRQVYPGGGPLIEARAEMRPVGKPVVTSISLKEGEEPFIRQARPAGAATGRRWSLNGVRRQTEPGRHQGAQGRDPASGSYKVVTERRVGLPARGTIIFDPNIFAVATRHRGAQQLRQVRFHSRRPPEDPEGAARTR